MKHDLPELLRRGADMGLPSTKMEKVAKDGGADALFEMIEQIANEKVDPHESDNAAASTAVPRG